MAGVDDHFAEIGALSDRVDLLEKANRALRQEKEELAALLAKSGDTGMGSTRSTTFNFNRGSRRTMANSISEHGVDPGPVSDEDAIHRTKCRLLWQGAIQAVMLAQQNSKILLLRGEVGRHQLRLEKANADISQARASLREAKKVQDRQSSMLEQSKQTIEEMRNKQSMTEANMAKEKCRLEEELHNQVPRISALGSALNGCSLGDQMSKSWGLDGEQEYDTVDALQDRIAELEEALEEERRRSEQLLDEEEMKLRMQAAIGKQAGHPPESREEESDLVAKRDSRINDLTCAKLSLAKRVKELELQLTEVIAQAGVEAASSDRDEVGEELTEEILMLQQDLAASRRAEMEWRDTAMMSYWQRFANHFCAVNRNEDREGGQVSFADSVVDESADADEVHLANVARFSQRLSQRRKTSSESV